MEYAYANIRWDGTVGITPGHYVAVIHDTATLFFIAPEQVGKLEANGELDRGGLYVRMIKFHPEDQFANIVLPGEVAELAEAATTLVDVINATGGIYQNSKGSDVPVEDPEWGALADAYTDACDALKVDPKRDEDMEETMAQVRAEREDPDRRPHFDHHDQRVEDEMDEMYPERKEGGR